METKEWRTIDKVTWGRGPWDDEPDKKQWLDEATGLPCLAVRASALGHWCGYVGVPVGHPAYGKGYADLDVTVHGGLTFADRCVRHDREHWERWRNRHAGDAHEAANYPRGDAVLRLADADLQRALADYDAFIALSEARHVCHVPERGETDEVWWLGFECARLRELSPGSCRLWAPPAGALNPSSAPW